MSKTLLKDLYADELADLLSAENQLVKALPKIIRAATSESLQTAVTDHLEQTKGHVARIEQLFEMLGEEAEEKECKAMKGLLEEGDEIVKEIEKGIVRDVALIGACQRVEHYEIAAYGTVRAIAEQLGLKDHVSLIQETLSEETAADEGLTEIAVSEVNPAANEVGMAKA